jgi:hypothetical protein
VLCASGEALRCAVRLGDHPYGVAYIISAPYLFTLTEHQKDREDCLLHASPNDKRDAEFRYFQKALM